MYTYSCKGTLSAAVAVLLQRTADRRGGQEQAMVRDDQQRECCHWQASQVLSEPEQASLHCQKAHRVRPKQV
jgi:hypothetical protein